jgi:hypothetical protein
MSTSARRRLRDRSTRRLASEVLQSLRYWIRVLTGRNAAARRAAMIGDPWRRLDLVPPLAAYGPGAIDDFTEYLRRRSRVVARTPEEIAGWLLACRYADDPVFLGEADFWQHPCAFEVVRCGDCEDFALWAWRKLVEASYDAEFVVGVRRRVDGISGRHAWVTYRDPAGEFVFDGVERTSETMIRPVSLARGEYEPQVGVGPDGQRFVYAGFYRTDWGHRMKLRRPGR